MTIHNDDDDDSFSSDRIHWTATTRRSRPNRTPQYLFGDWGRKALVLRELLLLWIVQQDEETKTAMVVDALRWMIGFVSFILLFTPLAPRKALLPLSMITPINNTQMYYKPGGFLTPPHHNSTFGQCVIHQRSYLILIDHRRSISDHQLINIGALVSKSTPGPEEQDPWLGRNGMSMSLLSHSNCCTSKWDRQTTLSPLRCNNTLWRLSRLKNINTTREEMCAEQVERSSSSSSSAAAAQVHYLLNGIILNIYWLLRAAGFRCSGLYVVVAVLVRWSHSLTSWPGLFALPIMLI